MKLRTDPQMKKPNHMVIVPMLLLSLFIVVACSREPQPINYGHDACSFCDMTIVSENFSAQAVSSKGKQFKYDSVECLVHHLGQEKTEMDMVWVSDYQHPGTMIDVQKAHFVIHDSLKSPMGANLAALRHKRTNTLSWEELQGKLLQNASGHGLESSGTSSETQSHH